MPSAADLVSTTDLGYFKARAGAERARARLMLITAASRAIEREVGRRIRYRGPATAAETASIVVSRPLIDEAVPGGSITQPAAAGTPIITVTDADPVADPPIAGTVTITGTIGGVGGQVRAFDLADGLVQHGIDFFTAYSGIDVAVTEATVQAADRIKIGHSAGYVEEHTRDCNEGWVLLPLEWPVRSILEVNEDASRAFGASTKLVAAGYRLVIEDGQRMGRSSLIRLSSNLPTPWGGGWRGNKLINAAGYTAADVPGDIKDCCRRLVELLQQEVDNEMVGLVSRTDPSGAFQRFAAAGVTPEMRRVLAPYRRRTYGTETGERDFDTSEAA